MLVLDNLNLHKSVQFYESTLKYFVDNPVILQYTPPHGSALNKIENIWNLMKRRLAHQIFKNIPIHKQDGVNIQKPESYLFKMVENALNESCSD